MKEPKVQFRTEEELKKAQNPRINAMKVRSAVGCLIPLVCMACAGAFVMAVIRLGPPKPTLPPGKEVVTKAAEEKEAEAATKRAVTERETLANLTENGAARGAASAAAQTSFEVGDEVQPVTDCMGFSEETDLNAFRAMLRHGDAAKARSYFEQMSLHHKGIKLPALLHMTVAASAWNGSLQVIVGTEQWWVANEWVELATEEDGSPEGAPTSVERINKKISEISETNRNAADAAANEMEKMKDIEAPAAEPAKE